jgi:hypothetical protein
LRKEWLPKLTLIPVGPIEGLALKSEIEIRLARALHARRGGDDIGCEIACLAKIIYDQADRFEQTISILTVPAMVVGSD